ncbi:MAG: SUMF1/EgtB/PvdO family nonheme iron enzyme [Planctomycetes bacterium]|nr:SUMF1/EgtB/PvdO family nonheme iron enzyme [Planctomycetota bacterium]
MIVLAAGASAKAVNIQSVVVANPGNAGELSGTGGEGGDPRICGSVAYIYEMGKFEVTEDQYATFLNAVAQTDPYGLYSNMMNIGRSGTSGNYRYNGASSSRPVSWLSWGDAARFCNWLTNGQPGISGYDGNGQPIFDPVPQNANSTEDGSYYLNGATTNAALMAVTRKANAIWVIPSEDEWYKAAYHKNDGVTANFWDYPTRTNTMPIAENPPGGVNSVNARHDGNPEPKPVGAYIYAASPYGTFDQGGNLWEWTEAVVSVGRQLRGGSFDLDASATWALGRGFYFNPNRELSYTGFRVAYIPEPATVCLLMIGALLARRKRW